MKTFAAYNINPVELFSALKAAGHPIREIRYRGPERKEVAMACVCLDDSANDTAVRAILAVQGDQTTAIAGANQHIGALASGVGQRMKIFKVLFLSFTLFAVVGCAPSGPWLFSTEADREELLLKEGMTVKECTTKKGNPLREAHYNPRALESYFVLSSDFTGVAYFQIKGSWSNEEVHFEAGRVVSIKYVRAPWMKY